jgi:hypothetical protein
VLLLAILQVVQVRVVAVWWRRLLLLLLLHLRLHWREWIGKGHPRWEVRHCGRSAARRRRSSARTSAHRSVGRGARWNKLREIQ